MANDPASLYALERHHIFEAQHLARQRERLRWTDREWRLARELADVAWEINPEGLYVYAAQKACERVQWARFQ